MNQIYRDLKISYLLYLVVLAVAIGLLVLTF